MASVSGQGVIRHLRRVALADGDDRTDSQLLEAFIARRDESAFAALVRRHGPMVLGVCRRIIGHHADAEDAFQAAFVVLARKAASLTHRHLLANWLYGVAYRTALEARTRMLRRHAKEKPIGDLPQPATVSPTDQSELLAKLDQELNRLSNRYRAPVVLCELEGRSRKETAELLGIPEGTLSSRLAMARKMLAKRLARFGLAISAGAILSQTEAPASAPGSLIESTVRVALADSVSPTIAALAQGAIKSMFLAKLKFSAIVMAAIGLTAGTITYGVFSARVAAAPQQEKRPSAGTPAPKPPKSDQERLQGAWKIRDIKTDGSTPAGAKSMMFYFIKDKVYIGHAGKIEVDMSFKLDTTASPKRITFTNPNEKERLHCIYSFDGEKLKLAFAEKPERPAPANFEGKNGEEVFDLEPDPHAKLPDIKAASKEAKDRTQRVRTTNNMKQILLALMNYHDQYKGFPAHAIVDKNGKPLLSWRVAILPYIEQGALYNTFHLNEPWDSDHNKKLLAQMPKLFGDKGPKTHVRVFVGPGAAFEGSKHLKTTDFTDGTSNTIMIVEAAEAVAWTRPDELAYDPDKPLPKFGASPSAEGFHIGMADGSVRFLPMDTPEKKLRAMITRDGGEIVKP